MTCPKTRASYPYGTAAIAEAVSADRSADEPVAIPDRNGLRPRRRCDRPERRSGRRSMRSQRAAKFQSADCPCSQSCRRREAIGDVRAIRRRARWPIAHWPGPLTLVVPLRKGHAIASAGDGGAVDNCASRAGAPGHACAACRRVGQTASGAERKRQWHVSAQPRAEHVLPFH